jgi:hypothetical protein
MKRGPARQSNSPGRIARTSSHLAVKWQPVLGVQVAGV